MSQINLSPANKLGIFSTLLNAGSKKNDGPGYVEVTMYACTSCDEVHEFVSSAERCCSNVKVHDEEGASFCPACGKNYSDPYEATDCCLWKDLDAPTRWRMAARVEAGESWTDVLGVSQ